jgi:hypothetical protein
VYRRDRRQAARIILQFSRRGSHNLSQGYGLAMVVTAAHRDSACVFNPFSGIKPASSTGVFSAEYCVAADRSRSKGEAWTTQNLTFFLAWFLSSHW